jgi:hypothetical protein
MSASGPQQMTRKRIVAEIAVVIGIVIFDYFLIRLLH